MPLTALVAVVPPSNIILLSVIAVSLSRAIFSETIVSIAHRFYVVVDVDSAQPMGLGFPTWP
jgi:hypothetical protein